MFHGYLRIGVILQCLGIAGRFAISTHETESDVYGWLFFDLNWSESVAQSIDDIGAYGCLVSAVVLTLTGLLTFGPNESKRMHAFCIWLDVAALSVVFAWSLAMAAVHSLRGEVYAELTLGEHATRIVLPLVFMLFVLNGSRLSTRFIDIVTWILVLGSSATFAVHGFKAIQAYGPFVDLILLTDMNWTKLELEQLTAEKWLWTIGWIDILVAGILIVSRWKWAAFYMAVWGLITALSRITALGQNAWPECLIRSANWVGPLLIVLIIYHRNREENSNRK